MTAAPSGSKPIDDPRVYLAAERTFLAWIRTSISLMGFGFLIARFALFLRAYGLTNGGSAPTHLGLSNAVGVRNGRSGNRRQRSRGRASPRVYRRPQEGRGKPPSGCGKVSYRRRRSGTCWTGDRHTPCHALNGKRGSHAAWNDRSGADGLEHGSAARAGRAGVRRIRRACRRDQTARGRGGHSRANAGRACEEAQTSPRHLADGARGGRRHDDRAARGRSWRRETS